jgi:hypothetical protein
MSASSSVGQRFSQLIQALGMSKNAFAISLDKTATVIQHLVDERNKPGFDLMNKVVDVYPNVSIEWLLRGKGPMLLNEAIMPAAVTAENPAAEVPTAPAISPASTTAAPKATPVTPAFPTPLFTVSAARPSSPTAPIPPAETPPVAPAPPQADAQAAPATTGDSPSAPAIAAAASPLPSPSPSPSPSPAQEHTPGAAVVAVAPAALDAATLTAALHAQHLQHQLALAEQRNQHLLEQQKLILERQALMQQMLDFMRRPI